MKHLVLDVNVVIDLWCNRDHGHIEFLFSKESDVRLWVSASSLPIIEYVACLEFKRAGIDGSEAKRLVKELLVELLRDVRVLSNFGYSMTAKVAAMASDLEDAQIAQAAMILHGDVVIVSNDKKFDTLGLIHLKTPEESLEWLKQSNAEKTADFIDLKTQQDILRPELEKNIHTVLHHGQYIMGPEVRMLEERLADYVGVKHCISASSGTDTLLISMMALGIGHGDEVITSPFTFIATGEMIALLGAKPVFIDIDSKSYNMNPDLLEAAITEKTKAIMPVSLFGQCADMDVINTIAERHGLPVIEDAAQSFGATYKGRRSCSLSTIGSTSFFPSKPLGGYGDGGALFTDDDALAKVMREIRVHGQDAQYSHPRIGINGRLDSLQAAILLAKMDVFPDEVRARERIGERYSQLLGDMAVTPHIELFNTSVYAQYTLQVDDRERVREKLKKAGIPTAVHYPKSLHLQLVFSYLNQPKGSFPVAESISKRVISLPMHPYLSEKDVDKVCEALSSCELKEGRAIC